MRLVKPFGARRWPAMLASIVIGIGSTLLLLPLVSASPGKHNFSNPKNGVGPYSWVQIVAMTPEQLVRYRFSDAPKSFSNQLAGGLFPFASRDIARLRPVATSLFLPHTFHTADGTSHRANDFKMIDLWKGTLLGHPFVFQIDKSRSSKLYIVGLMHDGKFNAWAFHQKIWITDFTGSYVVFYVPTPANGNPDYAIRLLTGVFLTPKTDRAVAAMSSADMGGYSDSILGLPKSYPVFQ